MVTVHLVGIVTETLSVTLTAVSVWTLVVTAGLRVTVHQAAVIHCFAVLTLSLAERTGLRETVHLSETAPADLRGMAVEMRLVLEQLPEQLLCQP